MKDINIKKSSSSKPYILAWFIIAILGSGFLNLEKGYPFLESLQCSKSGFGFVSVCLSGDIASVTGFGMGGLIIGLVIAFLIKIFRKNTNVWLIAFRIALAFGLISLYGVLI